MPTILVADDEAELTEILRDYLEAEGFHVLSAAHGDEALALFDQHPVHCVILDVMMPGKTGFEVCKRIRGRSDVPVLFMSARREDADKIRGLGLGGDDYVTKPFSPPEVVARVKAHLRRYMAAQPAGDRLTFGPLQIDTLGARVLLNGRELTLAAKEFELLLFLARNPGQLFSRQQLYDRVWGDFGDDRTVTVHINRLREKIEEDPANPRFIRTVRGLGYRFEGARA